MPDLVGIRSRFADELADPAVRQRFMASIAAETGDQSETARLAYAESVLNRAAASGRSVLDTVNDPHYYPYATRSQLGRTFNDASGAPYQSVINQALGGSNVSNLATGNESGKVHSGGAQVTFNSRDTGQRGDYERFVAENRWVPWRNQLLAGGVMPSMEEPLNPPSIPVGMSDEQLADQLQQAKLEQALQVAEQSFENIG